MAAKRKGAKRTKGQRARVSKERTGPTKVERIRHIVGLMSTGQWVTGVTGPELQELWGLSHATIDSDSGEASRIVREAVASSDDIRARVIATLEAITSKAMQKNQLRTAVESVKALAGVSGAEAPKKVNVGGNLGEILALGLAPSGEEPSGQVDG
jgi:hypothetical protein